MIIACKENIMRECVVTSIFYKKFKMKHIS